MVATILKAAGRANVPGVRIPPAPLWTPPAPQRNRTPGLMFPRLSQSGGLSSWHDVVSRPEGAPGNYCFQVASNQSRKSRTVPTWAIRAWIAR